MKQSLYLLPAMTTTRQARIDSAHARHDINTAGTWRATADGIEPPIHRQTPAQLYQTADKAVFFALRAREATSATTLFRELAQSAPTDRQRRELVRIAEEASDYQRQHDIARSKVESLTRIIEASTTRPADRLTAWESREQAKEEARKALEHVQALEQRMTDTSTSDREQLVQVAILAGLDPINATDPAGAFRRMTTSAGRAIADLASPDALRSTRTKLHPISAEEAQAEREAHPDIVTICPATGEEVATPCKVAYNVKGGASAGYYTIEHREQTKTRPAGWYRVHHYATIAPYVSYETFASGEGAEPIAKNDGINAIMAVSDREQIEALINRANLTERERDVVLKLCDQTAKRHAEQAHHEAMEAGREAVARADKAHRAQEKQRAEQRAESAYNKALWDSALTRSGIYAQSTRSKTQTRIIERMRQARTAPEAPTPAELEYRERKQWGRMQGNKHRGQSRAPQESAPDILGAVTAWASTRPHKPVVRWTELDPIAEREYIAPTYAPTLGKSGEHATPPARTAREQRELDAVSARLADFESKYNKLVTE